MSIFKKKEIKQEQVYRVLPNALANEARFEALQKKKRLAKHNLKKDIEAYMYKHRHDKFDTRPITKTFRFKAIEE